MTSSRALEVWKRFVGLFGGEVVRKKFGDTPPPEWVGVIGQLTDYQLERGMRRLLSSGKAGLPSLPEFRRMCLLVADDDLDPPQRSAGAIEGPKWTGDEWDVRANLKLLKHIMQAATERKYYVSAALTAPLVAWKNSWARDCREEKPTPDVETQNRWWVASMAFAEAEVEIARMEAAKAAA